MAVDNWTIATTANLLRTDSVPKPCQQALMFPGDGMAHTLQITVLRGSVPAEMAGAVVRGYFLRADGNTVVVTGGINGNVARITMTQDCYAVPGMLRVIVRMSSGDMHVTLAAHQFTIGTTFGGTPIVPGSPVQNLDDLLTYIEQLEELRDSLAVYDDSIQRLEAKDQALLHRINNLEAAADGKLFYAESDETPAYMKGLFSDIMPWIAVDMIGGKTIVDGDALLNISSAQVVSTTGDSIDTAPVVSKYFPDGMKSAGTVYDAIDLEHGNVIKRMGAVDLGTLTWSKDTALNRFYTTGIADIKVSSRRTAMICAGYNALMNGEGTSALVDGTVYYAGTGVYIHDARYATAEAFKAAMTGKMLNYELAQPITTQIAAGIEPYIECESGEKITFENDSAMVMAVPNKITYLVKVEVTERG